MRSILTRVLIKNKPSDGLLIDCLAGSIQDRRRENRNTSSLTEQMLKSGSLDQSTKTPSRCSKQNPSAQEFLRPIGVKWSLGGKRTQCHCETGTVRNTPRKSSPQKKTNPTPLHHAVHPHRQKIKQSGLRHLSPIRNRNSDNKHPGTSDAARKMGVATPPPKKPWNSVRFGTELTMALSGKV